jgi:ABC-2 type transport system ATP-binding protein
MNAIETQGLGHRYGRRWAVRDCTLTVPAGRVVGLVGANGAGKSTLLHMTVGLLPPTAGSLLVLDAPPPRERPEQLARVGFVAQDKPLYRGLRVQEMLAYGAASNPGWDQAWAMARIARLALDPKQRVGRLSGGQQAQVALTVALGKRPELLVLDEPIANLDPVARLEFLQVLMTESADTGLSVVLSSHLIADLERVCDHLIVLAAGLVQLAGDTEDILREHRVAVGPRDRAEAMHRVHGIVRASYTNRQATLLLRGEQPVLDRGWAIRPATLEEVVLAYMTRTTLTQDPDDTNSVREQVLA